MVQTLSDHKIVINKNVINEKQIMIIMLSQTFIMHLQNGEDLQIPGR